MKLVADFYTNKETECMINTFGTVTPSIKYPFHLINNCFKHVIVLQYLLLSGAVNLFIILLAPRLIPYKKMMAVKLGLVNIL